VNDNIKVDATDPHNLVIKIKREMIDVPCQNCGVNKVQIMTHTPYAGIFCHECMKPRSISVIYE